MSDKSEQSFEKRKNWIKNAIIIFLVVLLILTFFSNTIMNYSLPQVVVQYVENGTITTKVRGSGTVESGDPYNVMVKETRTISGVAVKVGDVVEEGQVLVYLAEGDSTELKTAKKALDDAQDAYDLAVLTRYGDAAKADSTAIVSLNDYKNQLAAARAAVDAAQVNVDTYQKQYDEASAFATALTNQSSLETAYASATNEAKNLATATAEKTAAQSNVDAIQAEYDFWNSTVDVSGNTGVTINDTYYSTAEVNAKVTELYTKLLNAKADLAEKTAAYNSAVSANAKKTSEYTNGSSSLAQRLAEANIAVAEKKALLDGATTQLKTCQTDLENLITDMQANYALLQKAEAVAAAKEELAEVEAKTASGEVTSPIAGKVTTVNAVSGKDTDASTPVVVLQPEGQGYVLSMSVTNEQAKLVSVGDMGELVNGWWYDDVVAKVTGKRADPSAPSQKTLITFDISGESISAGQSLTLSVGSHSASFDTIVPNSAVHEDNNGKFVLVCESKSTPLGNRYTAVRYDVTVLAKDDTKTAITSALSGYEYVITTSTKPIKSGDQVRLPENN